MQLFLTEKLRKAPLFGLHLYEKYSSRRTHPSSYSVDTRCSLRLRCPATFPIAQPGWPAGCRETAPLTIACIAVAYVAMKHMGAQVFDRELKKGSAELLILSLIEHRPRHGYEISKLIEQRSEGALKFNVASFYPLLYRLEKRGFITGVWVEKAGQRRRRYYKLTAQGKTVLKEQRNSWAEFVNAIDRITGGEHA